MDRPLTGEPLSLDLVNTYWRQRGAVHDALATTQDLAVWLGERGLHGVLASERMLAALVHTRTVLRAILQDEPGAEGALNAVLARGTISRGLRHGQVQQAIVAVDTAWSLAWEAADDYLRLLETGRRNIRCCEQASCILYFYDASGRRRWCSMAGCGNRAKAQRHYARQRSSLHAGGGEAQ